MELIGDSHWDLLPITNVPPPRNNAIKPLIFEGVTLGGGWLTSPDSKVSIAGQNIHVENTCFQTAGDYPSEMVASLAYDRSAGSAL